MLGVSCLATFMLQLDTLVVIVALPSIRRDLGLGYAQAEWSTGSYILAFASLMLLGGRLADRFGRRQVFLSGLVVFSLASLAAGLAKSADVLLTARAVQGVGAALVMPTTLTILSAAFPDDRERGFAVSVWGATIGAAVAAGPVLGGFITQQWYWGGVFLINVPLGLAGLVIGLIVIAQPQDRARARTMDLPGACLSLIGLFGISYALISRNDESWTAAPIVISLAAGIAACLAFAAVEARSPDPMIHGQMFADWVYSGGSFAIFLWSFAISAISIFVSFYLQNVLGLSPAAAGVAYLPMAVLTMALALLSAPLAKALGAARVVTAGYLIAGTGIAVLIGLGIRAHIGYVLVAFSLIGIGTGLTMPMQSAVIGALSGKWAGVASGVLNASRQVAALVGVAVGSAIIAVRRDSALSAGATPDAAYLSGYRIGLIVATAAMLTGAAVAAVSLRARSRRPADADEATSPSAQVITE